MWAEGPLCGPEATACGSAPISTTGPPRRRAGGSRQGHTHRVELDRGPRPEVAAREQRLPSASGTACRRCKKVRQRRRKGGERRSRSPAGRGARPRPEGRPAERRERTSGLGARRDPAAGRGLGLTPTAKKQRLAGSPPHRLRAPTPARAPAQAKPRAGRRASYRPGSPEGGTRPRSPRRAAARASGHGKPGTAPLPAGRRRSPPASSRTAASFGAREAVQLHERHRCPGGHRGRPCAPAFGWPRYDEMVSKGGAVYWFRDARRGAVDLLRQPDKLDAVRGVVGVVAQTGLLCLAPETFSGELTARDLVRCPSTAPTV